MKLLCSSHLTGIPVLVAILVTVITDGSIGQVQPSAGMMRYADVSKTQIVFSYADDLWLVNREGGTATPLASPEGAEMFPRFSSDGKKIAFMGNYDGGTDLYVISTQGGPAERITYHPSQEVLCDWAPDGSLIYSTNGFAGLARMPQLFKISAADPLPRKYPVPYGTNGALSSDGRYLAYTPYSRDQRTWKRYRGGMASDIWIFDLQASTSKRITDFEGTDSLPMWMDRTVYYLSDRGKEHRLNIWAYDVNKQEHRQVTRFSAFDIKWPSMGPGADGKGEIVFQNGSALYLLALPDGQPQKVAITIPGDRPDIRSQKVDVAKFINGGGISPSGKRAVVEARGDIWTLPAKNGSPRNLTATSGNAERSPSWSPDGRWIAYFSDATGEYELFVTQSDGRGETRQLTKNGKCFRYDPTWSPDSRKIAFTDKTGTVWLHDIESGETVVVDKDPTSQQLNLNWSHDSAWITYSKAGNNKAGVNSIWVYDVANAKKIQLTSGFFNDSNPTFDRKGDFIYFSSNRLFNRPSYDDVSLSFVYTGTEVLVGMPLRDDVEFPLASESDEEKWKDHAKVESDDKVDPEKKEADKEKGENDKKATEKTPEPIKIDFDGIERRCFRIPVAQGRFGTIAVNDKGQLIYSRRDDSGVRGRPSPGAKAGVKLFDFAANERKEKSVVDGPAEFEITPDGKRLGVAQQQAFYIIKAAPGQKLDKKIPTEGMIAWIEPREEWRQMFDDAWRIERDYFYDPYMHGVNWIAVKRHYEKMLPDCVSRRDLSFIIREMIAEINVGHAYYREGDVESGTDLETSDCWAVGFER